MSRQLQAATLLTAMVTATVISLGLAPAPASATSALTCGELGRFGEAGPSIVTVRATGVGCRIARRVLENYLTGSVAQGWECHSAGEEGKCIRPRATASYTPARRVRRCGSVGFEPNTDNVAGSIRAKRASCQIARKVARGSRSAGPTHPTPYSVAGFSCKGTSLDGPMSVALYVCHRDRATVVFART